MKLTTHSIFFIIVYCLSIMPQNSSVISINNGNEWIYNLIVIDAGNNEEYGMLSKQIIGDTTMTIHIATCDSSFNKNFLLKIVKVTESINNITTFDYEYWYVDSSVMIKNSSYVSSDYRYVFDSSLIHNSTCVGIFNYYADGFFSSSLIEDSLWNNPVQLQLWEIGWHFATSPYWYNLRTYVTQFYGPTFENYLWYSVLGGSEEKLIYLKGAILGGIVYGDTTFTDVNDNENPIPTEYKLEQNYPNPFNPTTKISWQSPVGSWQFLKVFDVLGREVTTLVDEYRNAGSYEVEFNASYIPSGVYFYQLKAGGFVETKKMILLK